MQQTIINPNNFSVNKINIGIADSTRNYALAISNNTILTSNPTGSIRTVNVDPFFYLSNAAISQPIYGNNLKIEVGSNANTASSQSSIVSAVVCYSLISNSGGGTLNIANNRGITANADVSTNQPGITITNNTALHIDSIATRGTTNVTNAYGIYITRPNHGTNRYGLFLEAVTGGTTAWSLYNAGSQFNVGTINAGQFKLNALNTPPISATDTGTIGEIKIDSDYIYICIASNTWKRAALSTW